jgi:hypothetical protein
MLMGAISELVIYVVICILRRDTLHTRGGDRATASTEKLCARTIPNGAEPGQQALIRCHQNPLLHILHDTTDSRCDDNHHRIATFMLEDSVSFLMNALAIARCDRVLGVSELTTSQITELSG